MANQELLDSIAQQRAAGAPDDSIKTSLTAAGWAGEDVNGAFAVLALANKPLAFASGDGFVSNHPYHNNWFSTFSIVAVILVGGFSIYSIYTAAGFPSFTSFVQSLISAPTNTLVSSSPTPSSGS